MQSGVREKGIGVSVVADGFVEFHEFVEGDFGDGFFGGKDEDEGSEAVEVDF